MSKKSYILMFGFLLVIAFFSLFIGSVDIDFNNLKTEDMVIIMKIRYPRILMGAISGAILSIVGMVMQTFTENDLAEPYILGISQGASFGAVLSIVYGIFSIFGSYNIYIGAFLGAFLAIFIVLTILKNDNSRTRLILIGVGVGALFQGLTMLVIYSSKNEAQVRSAMFWLVGSFSGVNIKSTYIPMIFLVIISTIFYKISKELDLLLLGRRESIHLGLNYNKIKFVIILLSSVATSVVVAKVGVIGFIGLIVPHISKKILKIRNHKEMLLLNLFLGAIVVIITDDIARYIFRPQEFPVGIISSLLGAPLFIFFIARGEK